ncbi:MAG: galactarate dehydratase [Saprospiraceae bacterium]|nr:galactarate dehydratase [Lewinella sp.]
MPSSNTIIRITESDNVGIIPQPEGLTEGSVLTDGTILLEAIPMGHKVALSDLRPGDAVIRYGVPIGYVNTFVPRGAWVDAPKMELPEPPDLEEIQLEPGEPPVVEPLTGYTFQGYRNPDGSVGTKNMLGITISVQCVAGMTQYIEKKIREELLPKYPNVDGVVALNHTYGCGIAIDAPAAIIPIRTIRNIVRNPNFGGEVMVIGLGCEKLRPERLLSEESTSSSVLYLQDESFHGFSEMVDGIMATAEQHLQKLNKRRRETCPVSDLVVGMQCGGSDAFSGLTGNPVSGYAADLIVRAGGTVLFSEVTEVRDAIHLLTPRAVDTYVARALVEEMRWYDDYLAINQADRSANPTPGNKRGGLSNVVEKALGSIAKSGTSPIADVLGPGERVRRKGLNFAATPAGDFVCGTLQLAAGMNLHVFITGRGTPYGLSMVPVVKLSSNSKLGNRWHDLIDFDAGPVAFGEKTIEEMGWELFHLLLAVASGQKTVAADRWGLHNELVLFNPGPLT